MKLDLNTSFGYPVLRPQNDDYIESAIQSSVDFHVTENLEDVEISYHISLSVSELKDLIAEGKARMILYIECRDTWFDCAHDASDLRGSVKFKSAMFKGQVVLTTLLISSQDIVDYSSTKFHPEYQGAKFNILENQILAFDEQQAVFISREIFKNISSLFDYVANDNYSDGEWGVDLESNHINIVANQTQLGCLRAGENTVQGKAALLNGIFLPALAYAIFSTKDDSGQYESYTWYNVLQSKMSVLSAKDKQMPLLAAQKLLRSPLIWLNKYMDWKAVNS